MPALTYEQVKAAAEGTATGAAATCLSALAKANVPAGAALKTVSGALAENFRSAASGALVVAVMKAGSPAAVAAWAALAAPGAKVNAAELIADAYLALDAWVVDWNRRQIRRVA